MGIKGLTPLLKKYAPTCLTLHPIQYLKGKTVAFDMSIYLYKIYLAKSNILADNLHNYKNFLKFITITGVNPILVFDGARRSPDKEPTLYKRKIVKLQAKEDYSTILPQAERLQILQALILPLNLETKTSPSFRHLMSTSFDSRLASFKIFQQKYNDFYNSIDVVNTSNSGTNRLLLDEISSYKALSAFFDQYTILKSSDYIDTLNISSLKTDISSITDNIKSLYNKSNLKLHVLQSKLTISLNNDEHIKIAKDMGFDCIVSESEEAEKTCAKLSQRDYLLNAPKYCDPNSIKLFSSGNEKISPYAQFKSKSAKGVFATASEDLDVLAFGGKKLFRMFSTDCESFLEIDRVIAQIELGLNYKQFVDLCILLGTDFSNTIPGVGPVKALGLIQKYKSIEGIINSPLYKNNSYPFINFNYNISRNVFFG
ncbi:hypothetical protein BB561_005592 [Smittium simulii]|uniref:XPG N-terminal domain-containing protein n=1 Tax=Smittium simulii TaxID=133385 RepID=A0A2T9Y9M1_9FUNG|nr:hypothetical protein BB561_005592 [Smittium simulii]